jgi:hypothetical protein
MDIKKYGTDKKQISENGKDGKYLTNGKKCHR